MMESKMYLGRTNYEPSLQNITTGIGDKKGLKTSITSIQCVLIISMVRKKPSRFPKP